MSRIAGIVALTLGLGLSPDAGAAPTAKLLVGSSGDCANADLYLATTAVHRVVRERIGPLVVSDEQAVAKLGQPLTSDASELQRRIEAAQMQYFNSNFAEAERQLLDTMAQVDQLPPGGQRARLQVTALQVAAQLYRGSSRQEQADDALRRVLKLSPGHRLDPVYFSPPARQRFERLRKELRRARRVPVQVTSSPSGAEVFIDGARVGVTPYMGDALPGTAEIRLQRDGRWSLPRTVPLRAGLQLHVDLGFEGAIGVDGKNCLHGAEDEDERLGLATKLGSLFGVEEVIVVRLERSTGQAFWVSAELVGTREGRKQRQGSVKIDSRTDLTGVAELASFILTGAPSSRVAETPPQEELMRGASPAPAVAPSLELSAEAPAVADRRGWRSVAGVGGLAVGAAGLVGGVLLEMESAAARAEVERHYAEGNAPSQSELPRLRELADRADGHRTLALAAGGAGLAFAALGAVLVLGDRDDSQPQLTVGVDARGAVRVAGSW